MKKMNEGKYRVICFARGNKKIMSKNFYFYMKISDKYYSQTIASTLFSKHNLIQNL